jgi:HK97 family phage portal protein
MANIISKAINKLVTKSVIPLVNNFVPPIFFKQDIFSFNKQGFKAYENALGENALLFMVLDRIASTTSTLPLRVEDLNGKDTDNSKILEHLKFPNSSQSYIDFYYDLCINVLTTGNIYIREIKGIGSGVEYTVLTTSKVEILATRIGIVNGYRVTLFDNTTEDVPADEILHIKYSNTVNTDGTDSLYGLSPLQPLWTVLEASKQKLIADSVIFKNRGVSTLLSNGTDTIMLPDEKETIQKEFDSQVAGADKTNKVLITSANLKAIQIGMSPTDLKLLEGVLGSLRLITANFKISSILFNDSSSSTESNVLQKEKSAYLDCYIPLAEFINAPLSRWISERVNAKEVITVNKTDIEQIRASTNKVASALSNFSERLQPTIINSMTENEIREMLTLDDVPKGAKTLNTINNEQSNSNTESKQD